VRASARRHIPLQPLTTRLPYPRPIRLHVTADRAPVHPQLPGQPRLPPVKEDVHRHIGPDAPAPCLGGTFPSPIIAEQLRVHNFSPAQGRARGEWPICFCSCCTLGGASPVVVIVHAESGHVTPGPESTQTLSGQHTTHHQHVAATPRQARGTSHHHLRIPFRRLWDS
jgi:hypothetical protein